MWTRALLLGALVLACCGVVGCAQERAPINQVQADALAKSFFVGPNLADASTSPEFYMRGTIIDVGYGAAEDGLFTSTYAQPLSRIRWEITENYLNARLSYELIANTDGKGDLSDNGGLVKKTTNDGQIVASYKISSHFDIERAYNPTTGEELNVVVENSTDRPWYQREYFRVDWSQNLAADAYNFDTLSSLGWIGGIQYDPLAFTVLDPNDPNAPHFDTPNGYFDVTVKAFAKPAIIDLSSLGWGINQIPACQLPGNFAGGTAPYGDCNPVEITLRYSFRQVVDKDYEPMNYDGYRFQAFGIFTTERNGYARDYGMTDAQWFRFASRYNIWDRSHYYTDPDTMSGSVPCATYATTEAPTGNPNADPNRDTNNDGTADECASVNGATLPDGTTIPGGSQCDIFNKKCTLPYRARKPVTIPWYMNGSTTTTVNSLEAQIAATTDPTALATLQTQLAAAEKQGEDIFEATNWAVQEWDLALKTAIQTARLVECKRTGGTAASCAQQFPMWVGQQEDNDEAVRISRDLDFCRRNAAGGTGNEGVTAPDSTTADAARTAGWTSATCLANVTTATQALAAERGNASDPSALAMNAVLALDPVLVLCHNPVTVDDHPACGALGLAPRLGDIRYNTVLNIDKPQTPSAWGIMVDADDPLSGEKVAASINIWSAVTDIAAQSLVDLVRYANGELTTADITNGTYINNWVQAAQLTSDGSAGATMSKLQIQQRLAAGAGMSTQAYAAAAGSKLASGLQSAVQTFHDNNVMDAAIDNTVASPSASAVNARFMAMHNSTTEAPLLNAAMMQRAGISSQIPVGSVADQVSPMALGNPRVTTQFMAMREQAMASQGYCLLQEAPEMSSLTGIADAMKRKFPKAAKETAMETDARYNAMLSYIRRRYHYAVLAHEMGHSVGLRHNFVSTYAALHYRPQYWQLRTSNGTQTTPCPDAVTDGSTCTGPRYWDPLTEEEQSQMIWMFMQSTVMDYPGDVSQDTLGLGAYDFAAARMFYGDTTSVYNVETGGKLDTSYLSSAPIGQGMLGTTDNFGGLVGIQYALGTANAAQYFHYSQLQANYKLINNCQTVPAPTAPDWWRTDVDGAYDPLFDGHVVSVGGKTTKCRSLPVDYMGWNQLRLPTTAEAGAFYRGGNAVDPATRRVRVPYSFASDNWADTGNVSVFRHDNGGDPYEQMQFLITTQEDRHILDNFRRGRTTFNVRAAGDRSYSRYNEKMYGIANGIGFLGNIYKDFSAAQGISFNTLWPYIIDSQYKDNMIGATLAFDHFTRELSRPESGPHYFNTLTGSLPKGMQDNVLRSAADADGNAGTTAVIIPEGSTGYLGIEMTPGVVGSISFGGHLLENGLATNQGDYDVDYPWNCGSYYDKIHSAIFLSLSEDRFISQSRQDFYDARFRSVGMADIVPDGYRRVIANSLTNDRSLLAPRITADAVGNPLVTKTADPYDPTNKDALLYPHDPIGWTSWWPSEGPMPCFSLNGSNVCAAYDGTSGGFNPQTIANTATLDPQIGWEVQKFMIAYTLAYIPADQQANWVDMMRIYKQGPNSAPAFNNRIEWQDPVSGDLYYAKTYGMECLFGSSTATTKTLCEGTVQNPTGGHWVQQGIAARVLEYANFMTSQGFACDPNPTLSLPPPAGAAPYSCASSDGNDPNSLDGFDPATGRFHFATMANGTAVIRLDPTMQTIGSGGAAAPPNPTCDTDLPDTSSDCNGSNFNVIDTTSTGTASYCGVNKLHAAGCTTALTQWDNHWVPMLAAYKEVPDYLYQVVIQYGLGDPAQLGLFP
jgi:hypothetical protein